MVEEAVASGEVVAVAGDGKPGYCTKPPTTKKANLPG
jgi:hypothetical protein